MWQSFLWILTIVILVGIFGSISTYPAVVTWYPSLNKPPLHPPNWIFWIVWVFMYILLILSTYFAYESLFPGWVQSTIVVLFVIIALLLALWPYIFFYRQNLGGGLIVILLTLLITAAQVWIMADYACNSVAAALLTPLFAWLIFATYLNIGIVFMN